MITTLMNALPLYGAADQISQDAEAMRLLLVAASQQINHFYHLEAEDQKAWQQQIGTTAKADDSPITQADLAAHTCLQQGLSTRYPAIPVISEESADLSFPATNSAFWLVDPLDGTKEFLKRTGEFTVNVALIDGTRPVAGFIALPTQQQFWGAWGGQLYTSTAETPWQAVLTKDIAPQTAQWRLSYSRTSTVNTYDHLIDVMQQANQQLTIQRLGSAYKFAQLALGQLDIYPRLHPTMEWDTAAGQALVEAVGGCVTDLQGRPFRYGCRSSWKNQEFIALRDRQMLKQVLQWIQTAQTNEQQDI